MKLTEITAMDTVALNAVINSFRTGFDPRNVHGNLVTRIRQLVTAGKIDPAHVIDNGVRPVPTMTVLSLTKEAVEAVLLSYESYGVAEAARALLPAPAPVESRVLTTLTVTETDGVQTMSSLDMVDYINSTREAGEGLLRHDNFMAKVPDVLGKLAALQFKGVYLGSNGETRPCYNFPKREAMLMAMSYSHKLQATVYDAWQEAEAKLAPAPTLAIPATYLDALKQLVATVEVTERQQLQLTQQAVQIEAAKPAVAFVEEYVQATGLKSFRQVATLLVANEREFRNFLVDHKFMQQIRGEWQAFSQHKLAGRLVNQESVVDGVVRTRCFFTAKGVEYVAKKWKERTPLLRKPVTKQKNF